MGYYPKGMGEVTLTVEPCRELKPLLIEEFGEVKTVKGVSVCTFLAERKGRRTAGRGGQQLSSG